MTTSVQTKYDVGGVLLDRPFKIRRLGHFGFNVVDIDEARHFYIDLLGFIISDEASFPASLIPELSELGTRRLLHPLRHRPPRLRALQQARHGRAAGCAAAAASPDVTINQITWQVGSLGEVGNARRLVRASRASRSQRAGRDMPGSNWHTYVLDPDGHTNELYYGIEQVGWDGYSKPRRCTTAASTRRRRCRRSPSSTRCSRRWRRASTCSPATATSRRLPATYDVDGVLLPRPFKIVQDRPGEPVRG